MWLTIKGDMYAAENCLDDLAASVTSIDVWFGGFNVVHYAHTIDAVMMNSLLKQSRPMLIGDDQDINDVMGLCFPILFGAPYINELMALPKSLSNRKVLTLGLDIANDDFDDLLLDIVEVILPDAHPVGFIKQEELGFTPSATGDLDVWLQHNWDLLKLVLRATTVPCNDAWTTTINRAGLEIDDFVFGYEGVPWTILHGELMDEITGMAGIENHIHTVAGPADTTMAQQLEHWERFYAVMDFFFEKDLKWKAPLSVASTAKLKMNIGVAEACRYLTACYVPTARVS